MPTRKNVDSITRINNLKLTDLSFSNTPTSGGGLKSLTLKPHIKKSFYHKLTSSFLIFAMLFQVIGGVFCVQTGSTGIAKAAGATYYVNSNCSSDCDGSTPAKGWSFLSYATNAVNVPSGSTVEVVAGSGPYYERFSPSSSQQNITWNFNNTEIRRDVDLNSLANKKNGQWVASVDPAHSGQYYFLGNGVPMVFVKNGDMEANDGNWVNYETVSTNEQSATSAHSGSYSRHVVANAGGVYQIVHSLISGKKYRISGFYYLVSGGLNVNFFGNQPELTTQGSWQPFSYDVTATDVSQALYYWYGASSEFYLDDVAIQELDDEDNPVVTYDYDPWGSLFTGNSSQIDSAVVDGTWSGYSTRDWSINKWDWGDYDSLGFSTFYVGWSGGNPAGTDAQVLVPIDTIGSVIGIGSTGHIINNIHLIGADTYLVTLYEAATFNNSLFKNANEHAIDIGSGSGGNLNGATITNSQFIDCGHRGINIDLPVNPLNVYNNYFYGCHLMLRNDAVNNSVVNFKNNSQDNALAGSIQWTNNSSTLNESNNQFNINENSSHGSKKIGFDAGDPSSWLASNSTDIPSSFDVGTLCDGNPENCGTNPLVNNDGSPLSISPLIDSGTPISGITTDYLGNHIYGNPDIGAYEYQPPYTIGTDDINISSPIRIYADGKYRYTNTVSGSNDADLTVIPQAGFGTGDYSQWMDININTWHTSTDYYKKWTESSTIHDLTTTHTIGDLQPNVRYTLKVDGQASDTYVANDQGQISFTYNGGYSTKTFELEETPSSSSFIAPSKPSISNLDITNNNGTLSLNNLPATITQIAISTSPDFTNSSWEDISKKDDLLKQYTNTDTLYIKFRTQEGGVSDTIIKEGNNITGNKQGTVQNDINDNNTDTNDSNQSLQDGDIVKTTDSSDIYVIKYKNNKQYKRLLLSPAIFNYYLHLKWNNIKTISQQQLDQYQTSNLVKETTDTVIYTLTSNGDTGKRKPLNPSTPYDPDSIYEINKPERDSYELED